MTSEIMTLSETAAYLKISEKSISRLIQKREIPYTKVGNQYRFSKA
ncbi:MAG: helix-turn-helix domain-containing protein [Spirochaetia bacterium]